MKNNSLLVAGSVVFRKKPRKDEWLLVVQNPEGDWELPKITVRKGESSVRASLRMTSEMAGMNTRVLEEAGHTTGVVSMNGKQIPKKVIYYLMIYKAGGEILGFDNFVWLSLPKAYRKISSKKEKDMLQSASKVLQEWRKKRENSKKL